MTRCPLARESVPRTRRRPLVRSTSDQRRASVSPRLRPVGASRRISGAYATGHGDVVPSCPRHTCRLTLAAGLLASSSSRTAVASSLWPRWASRKRRSANYARSSGSPGRPSTARLSERRSTPGRRTSALSKGETESALERPRTKNVRRATSPFDARPCPGERSGGASGPARVLPETARRGDDRQTFGNWDGGRSTNTTAHMLDDSALRECDESRSARYSERHSAHQDAGGRP
jgi:hypothetical protein